MEGLTFMGHPLRVHSAGVWFVNGDGWQVHVSSPGVAVWADDLNGFLQCIKVGDPEGALQQLEQSMSQTFKIWRRITKDMKGLEE